MFREDWLVIVNPNAGRRKASDDWKIISALLVENNIPFRSIFTAHAEHAIRLTEAYIKKGFKNILAIGGDGTFNEVANGILSQRRYPSKDINMALIPVGTGNDWARMYGIPFSYQEAVALIKRANTKLQDASVVHYYDGPRKKKRYIINNAGIGLDALVAKRTNRQKLKEQHNSFAYFINIFSALLSYRPAELLINMDGRELTRTVLSMNAGICQYNGGGMKQLPLAVPDDGFLDVTIISKIPFFRLVVNVHRLYNGSIYSLKQVEHFRVKELEIRSRESLSLEVDGESLGTGPYYFSILPQALRIIVP